LWQSGEEEAGRNKEEILTSWTSFFHLVVLLFATGCASFRHFFFFFFFLFVFVLRTFSPLFFSFLLFVLSSLGWSVLCVDLTHGTSAGVETTLVACAAFLLLPFFRSFEIIVTSS